MVDHKNIHDVKKFTLDNGLTVLVRPLHTIPKVSVQLWYNVGSKDEKDSERGIAHLIEHMIFKGTEKLKESDIDTVVHMLSGSCNAFTSYDYTGYLFNLPSQHWQESFNLMADCMQNASFKDYMLNSEMKAVIQELKLYKDRYDRSLVDEMISMIFHDHPYHHPIIGYKQDLWSVTSDNLRRFYKEHYVPNNATLVVVGDVDPKEVYELAKKKFGSIKADPAYQKKEFYFNNDIASKSITIYRDIQQPIVFFAFVTPGLVAQKDGVLELLARILGKGKGSRLYKKIVNDLKLATSLSASAEDLFDYGLFFITVEPRKVEDIETIRKIILDEIENIRNHGVTDSELTRAIKKTEISLHSLMEDFEHQAYEIGKYYLATGDQNYLFNYLNKSKETIKNEMHDLLVTYFRSTVLHQGSILPLPSTEKNAWSALQDRSDQEDNEILSARKRNEPIEEAKYAKAVKIHDPLPFSYPKATKFALSNGLKLFSFNNTNTPKVDIILDFKVKHYFDPDDKEGLSSFMSALFLESTKKHTAHELIDLIEERGMTIAPFPGGIALSILKEDLGYALSLLNEILTQPAYKNDEIEKVRHQLIAKVKNFWDEPRYFVGQLTRKELYKNHPYSKNSIGSVESISSITQKDLQGYHDRFITPRGARMAIVGDLEGIDLPDLLEKNLGSWHGKKVEDILFPALLPVDRDEINHYINRDQVILRFAAQSVDRKNPDYDKLLLFDQIFGGGVLGAMHSRLFQLREQSGLFYTIAGSLIAGADEQPGMILVQTIVSLDRLAEAEKAIKETIFGVAETITPEELADARRALINSQVDSFASNYSIASALLFLDKYGFSDTFFDNRAALLNAITLDQIKDAAKRRLDKNILTVRVGRVLANS